MTDPVSLYLLLALAIYCAVQAFRDFRRKHYAMAALGAALTLALLAVPVHTQSVTVDLPPL